ncbi:MAG: endolytic transglycosylase MltG [Crocinitomicaceae bacterium]|nr:endolytic transglycosylase MltG [Crocinitomicaceae bacterium]
MGRKGIIIILIGLLGAGAYLGRHRIKAFFSDNTRTINGTEVKLLFREDPSVAELATTLVEKGILSSKKEFFDAVTENTIDTNSFAAGKYIILTGTTHFNLVDGFVKAENGHGKAEKKVRVLFNRCEVIADIGSNISKCILADSASIVDYILDENTLNKYNFTAEQVPALFIPKEYQMYFDTDAEEFVAQMAAEFKAYWTAERMQKLKNVGLNSPSQAVTLASIVYSEQSRVSEEWPIIAKLYLNRIEQGIPLQADPTFKFCWPDRLKGVERLLDVHRDKDCPYNTYIYKGIPPGPICLPPYKVVDAVLNPADVSYIFLCGDGTGHHNFATTNAEHNKNVAAYRIWLKEYLKNKSR